jgi:uncharacterized protein
MKPKTLPIVAAFAVLLAYASEGAAESPVTALIPNGTYVTTSVKSLKEMRYKSVVPQKYDLSCGAAALATILKYFYDENLDEEQIIRYMLQHGDQEQIAHKGFSLLDLKRYAEHLNYQAAGFKEVPLANLRQLKIPCILLFNTGKYMHFVVLKGIVEDKVFLADPSYGNRSMSLEDFEKEWNKVLFVVASQNGQGHNMLTMERTLGASEMDIIRLQTLGLSGFTFSQSPHEF